MKIHCRNIGWSKAPLVLRTWHVRTQGHYTRDHAASGKETFFTAIDEFGGRSVLWCAQE